MIQKFTITVSLMIMLMSHISSAQKIVAIGSSTVSGEGADPRSNAWLNLYGTYLTGLGLPVTIVNLGASGTTSFNGLPSSYATPSNANPLPPDLPFLNHNITYALTLHPDIVLIAYPSNDFVLGFTMTQFLANLRTIYDSALAMGKIAYVSTSQPRNDLPTPIRVLLRTAKDSILAEFAGHTLDFWTPLADPVTLGFKTGLTSDAIHPNNAGHQLLFQVARDANIIPITPLPIKLTGFKAIFQDQKVHLQWRSSDQTGAVIFKVQRSGDGLLFDDRWQEQSSGTSSPTDHSWTDGSPLSGRSFYRIMFTEQGLTSYSGIVSILNASGGWKIGKLYPINGSLWNLEVLTGKGGNVMAHLVDGNGRSVLRRTIYVNPPSAIVPLDLSGLAAGEYFLQLSAPDGGRSTRAIQKR
jgi:lysophospholipase L1-like esterase